MNLVEFDEDALSESPTSAVNTAKEFHIRSPRINIFGSPETPTMIKLLLKSGLAKNEKQALFILIGVVVAIILGCFILLRTSPAPHGDTITLQSGEKVTIEAYLLALKHKQPLH